MLINNRIIWKDNLTLTDLSVKLNNYHSGSQVVDIIAADDAIYIGSDMPFNHRYFEFGVVNTSASVLSVSIWDGTEWEAAVDVVDQTSVAGKTFAQNGIVSWVPDRNGSGWGREETTENIPDVSTLKIYNLYWAKITFSADLLNTTAINFIGHKFSEDEDLAAIYPELNLSATKSQFLSGKTNWNEQHIHAAEAIIKRLREKKIIFSRNQILNWEIFTVPSIHQVASIIYRSFGDDYKDNFEQSNKDFHAAMNLHNFEIDRDLDGKLDPIEKIATAGFFRR